MPADDVAVLARRVMAAQLAMLFGPPELKTRVRRMISGQLADDEAVVMRAELDAMARMLAGG